MNGRYNIDSEHIRSLAIICHALDGQFDSLFNSPTVCGFHESIYRTYNRTLASNLLHLAVSIRVSRAHLASYKEIISPCGFLDCQINGVKTTEQFSVKDVCDKIIHADSFTRPIEAGTKNGTITLTGKNRGQEWTLHLSLALFCEYILDFLNTDDKSET